jgi:hypothetical protein
MAHRDSSIQTPLTFDLVVMRTLMLSARSTNGNGAPAALGTTEIVACPVRTAIGRHVDWCENSKCGIVGDGRGGHFGCIVWVSPALARYPDSLVARLVRNPVQDHDLGRAASPLGTQQQPGKENGGNAPDRVVLIRRHRLIRGGVLTDTT